MSELQQAVAELMADQKQFYLEFLQEQGLKDHPIVRLGFYVAAEEEIMEEGNRLDDPVLQVAYVKALKAESQAAWLEVRELEFRAPKLD